MKRSMPSVEDEYTQFSDKKMCHCSYWKSSGIARISEKYVCCIHHNDELICSVYDCKGSKVNIKEFMADNVHDNKTFII